MLPWLLGAAALLLLTIGLLGWLTLRLLRGAKDLVRAMEHFLSEAQPLLSDIQEGSVQARDKARDVAVRSSLLQAGANIAEQAP